jgi:hypothetical protein
MAVTLEIKDTAKGSKNLPSPAQEAISSSLIPQEKQMGLISLGVWLTILFVICLPWWFFEATLPFAIGLPIWCFAAIIGGLFLGPPLILKKLKEDAKARVSNQNHPTLKNVLNRVSPILGVDEPEA